MFDYEINYDLGTLRVTNQAIINSGVPVNIQYENQAAFAIQQKNFMGLRLDYMANKKLALGGTIVKTGENGHSLLSNLMVMIPSAMLCTERILIIAATGHA